MTKQLHMENITQVPSNELEDSLKGMRLRGNQEQDSTWAKKSIQRNHPSPWILSSTIQSNDETSRGDDTVVVQTGFT